MNKCPNCSQEKIPYMTDTMNVNYKVIKWYKCEDCNLDFNVYEI